jgi:5-methylcytosine-specific restriction endonuclease McrA
VAVSAAAKVLSTQAYKRLRLAVLDRDLWLCQVRLEGCTRYATQVDHVVPRHEGGAVWDPANLRASCASCNVRRRLAGRPGSPNDARRDGARSSYVGRF